MPITRFAPQCPPKQQLGLTLAASPLARGLLALVVAAAPLRAQAANTSGMIVYQSDAGFAATLARVDSAVKKRGLFVMHVLDHSAAAAKFGQTLAPNTVVLFGNPQVGSQLMACAPRVAIDLPQKLLVWEETGRVKVGYNDPSYLARRHGIQGCAAVLKRVEETLRAVALEVAGGTG